MSESERGEAVGQAMAEGIAAGIAGAECGQRAPESLGWPHGGLATCSEPAGHDGDHVAWAERGGGIDVLEAWPQETPAWAQQGTAKGRAGAGGGQG